MYKRMNINEATIEVYRHDDCEFIIGIGDKWYDKIFHNHNEANHICEFLKAVYKEIPLPN